jgi:peptidylprolyl isomerase
LRCSREIAIRAAKLRGVPVQRQPIQVLRKSSMRLISSFVAALFIVAGTAYAEDTAPAAAPKAAQPAPAGAGDKLVIELKSGKVVVKLRPDLAPKHVTQVKTLAGQGFYNGVKWHRVIEGFMAQTGDPTGTGMGGSKLPNIPAEFTKAPFRRGTVGAARSGDPNSANSQFFICFNSIDCKPLEGQYTVWGEVVEGMELVDKIKRGAPGSGTVTDPDVMVKVTVQ